MNSAVRTVIVALGLSLIATALVLGYLVLSGRLGERDDRPKPPQYALVVARVVEGGHIVQREDLTWRNLRGASAPRGALTDGAGSELSVVGSIARRRLQPGELLTQDLVARPDAGAELTTAINPGWRAVTLKTDTTDTASGLLRPNDRVDVIYIKSEGDGGGAPAIRLPFMNTGGGGAWASRILLENVRVLAVNGKLDPKESGKAGLTGGGALTLEVRPPDAERLLASANSGRLGYLLRRHDEPTLTPAPSPQTTGAAAPPIETSSHAAVRPPPIRKAPKAPAVEPPPPPALIIRAEPDHDS